MDVKLMVAASSCRLLRGFHVDLVDLVNILEELLLQEQGVVSIVVLRATGLVIARMETGKTNAIVVENEDI